MRIGILGAIQEEVGQLVPELGQPASQSIGGRTYYSGSLAGHDIVLAWSRMGKVAAASTATTLLDHFGVDRVIFTGVAGAAAPALNVGDVVIATALVQHDLDARPLFARFEVPLLGISRFRLEAALTGAMVKAAEEFVREDLPSALDAATRSAFGLQAPNVATGLIASGDQFVADPTVLAALRRALPELLCVEMEGAAVAQVCHEHAVPLLVVRVISDRADHSAPVDFTRFISSAARHYSRGILRRYLSCHIANAACGV